MNHWRFFIDETFFCNSLFEPPSLVQSSRREGRKESVRGSTAAAARSCSEGVSDDVRVRGGGGISGHNGISDFSLTSGKGRLMPERQHWLFKSGLNIKKIVWHEDCNYRRCYSSFKVKKICINWFFCWGKTPYINRKGVIFPNIWVSFPVWWSGGSR